MATHYEMLMERNTGAPDARRRGVARRRVSPRKPTANSRSVITFGPYGEDVPLRRFLQEAWDAIEKFYPDIIANSSLKNLKRYTETPDPPRAGCRTAIWSYGGKRARLRQVAGPARTELAGRISRPGRRDGMGGRAALVQRQGRADRHLPYRAAGQWRVASLKPPHLFALSPWMGA